MLRDLNDSEFFTAYDCDRFTASVLASRFRYIIEHVSNQLITYAFSPVIRESGDMSATLTGPPSTGHAMAAVSQTIPLFYGSMPEAVRISLEEYGIDDLVPGDVVIVNDPYRVGTHLNDVCFIRPVFLGGQMVGAMTIRAHMLDWGGKAIGGFEVTKKDLYEDGLVLPPTLLFRAGAPVRSTFNLILDNTRFGPIVLPDIQTIGTSLELGERLLLETIHKYGYDAYVGGIRYACDASAETMSAALAALPDGVYEGEEWLDSDGLREDAPSVVRVRMTKCGDRAEFDFTGTSAANDSAINCPWPSTKTAVVIALKYLIDPHSPFTSGALRNVDLVLPPDTIVNPSPPHSCMFYWEPVLAAMNATFQAVNPALGRRAIAHDSWGGTIHFADGTLADGTPWFSNAGGTITPMGPWGGTEHADGDSTQVMIFLNMLDGGCEPAESDNPVVILRNDHVPDSAGPGLHRSGAASITDSLWLAPGQHRVSTFHIRRPPGGGGVVGGRPGTLAAGWLWDPSTAPAVQTAGFLPVSMTDPVYAQAKPLMGVLAPDTNQLDPDGSYHLMLDTVPAPAGSVIRFVCNGAGGWGDPLDRDPVKVLADVRDEYVTIEGAARDYGVVVAGDPIDDPEGLVVDAAATDGLRRERRDSTGSAGRAIGRQAVAR